MTAPKVSPRPSSVTFRATAAIGAASFAASAAALILLLASWLSGCTLLERTQTLATSATNAYPLLAAEAASLTTALKALPQNTYTDIALAIIAIATAALGLWARLIHGTVKQVTSSLSDLTANNNATTKPAP